MENKFQQLLEEYRLNGKLQAVANVQQEIAREITKLGRRTNYGLPVHMPKVMRKRRTTPMLGFLEGIIGSVAGLLTYDDRQQIENEISELNQAAANLSHLLGKQTQVVRASFEEIDKQLGAYGERQKQLKFQLAFFKRTYTKYLFSL